MWPVKDVSSTEMYTLELWQEKTPMNDEAALNQGFTWIFPSHGSSMCVWLGSIGPEPLRLVLHEAEVPWQTISAMTPAIKQNRCTEYHWVFVTFCKEWWPAPSACLAYVKWNWDVRIWWDISHRWNPGKMFFLPFTEALMGKLSMSCDHTLGVFVVDELNGVNDYFSIFFAHSCLPSKFPTQSSGLAQLQCFVSPRKFCVWAHPHPSINVEHPHSSQRLPPRETVGPGKLARRTANAWVWKQFVEHCWDSMNCCNSSKHSLWGVNRCQRREQSHAKGQQKKSTSNKMLFAYD